MMPVSPPVNSCRRSKQFKFFSSELAVRLATCVILLALASPLLFSQEGLGPLERYRLSPYDLNRIVPGMMAPDFRLQDQDGRVHQLSQYRGRNVVLVIYRGHW